jgi:hypothetical protein
MIQGPDRKGIHTMDTLSAMLEIARLAIEVDELEAIAATEKVDLSDSYDGFKRLNAIDHVGRDTPEWEAMMRATSGEYASYQSAKRKSYNAKRRLKAAIRRAIAP